MESSPNQRRAIITGASSGIGKATAFAFAREGIEMALISRQSEKLMKKILALGVLLVGIKQR